MSRAETHPVWSRRRRERSQFVHWTPIASVTMVGAAVLSAGVIAAVAAWHQSLWFDESYTALIARASPASAFHYWWATESNPPLHYLLVWVMAHVFGGGQVVIRSVSIIAFAVTPIVAWRIARDAAGPLAGVLAAFFTASNAMLAWYGTEARPYALFVLVGAASVWAWLRAMRTRDGRDLAVWVICGVACLLTQSFSVFPLAFQAVTLLAQRRPEKRVLVAVAALGLSGVALTPLVLAQRTHGPTSWIHTSAGPLGWRIPTIFGQFARGVDTALPHYTIWAALAILVLAAAGCTRAPRRVQRDAMLLVGCALTTVVLPELLAYAGADYLIARNVIVAIVPLACFAAIGLSYLPRAAVIGGVIAAMSLVAGAQATRIRWNKPAYQRDNWRGAIGYLRPTHGVRVVLITPINTAPAVLAYLPNAQVVHRPLMANEVDLVFRAAGAQRTSRIASTPPPPSLRRLAIHSFRHLWVIRYVPAHAATIRVDQTLIRSLNSLTRVPGRVSMIEQPARHN